MNPAGGYHEGVSGLERHSLALTHNVPEKHFVLGGEEQWQSLNSLLLRVSRHKALAIPGYTWLPLSVQSIYNSKFSAVDGISQKIFLPRNT